MEKVKIKSATIKKTGTSPAGKSWTIRRIMLEDGREGDSFDEFVIEEECQIEITPNENPDYLPNFKKIKEPPKKDTVGIDISFEKKKCALNNTVQMRIHSIVDDEHLKECFDKFVKLLS